MTARLQAPARPAAPPLKLFRHRAAPLLVAVAVYSTGLNVLAVLPVLYIVQVTQRAGPEKASATIMLLSLIFLFALTVEAVVSYARHHALGHVTRLFDTLMAAPVFRAVIDGPVAGLRHLPGNALADYDIARRWVFGQGARLAFELPGVVVFSIVAWLIHPYIAYLLVGMIVVLAGLIGLREIVTHRAVARQHRGAVDYERLADRLLRGNETILGLGLQDAIVTRWREARHRHISRIAERDRIEATFDATEEAVRSFTHVAAIAIACWLVIDGDLLPVSLTIAFICALRAIYPLSSVIRSWSGLDRALDAYRRLARRLDATTPAAGGEAATAPAGPLELRRVGAVAGNRALLAGIDLVLHPGDRIGIIGPNGAGKSTLARLMVGASLPDSGEVRLAGHASSRWSALGLGRHVGYVPQDIDLIPGTAAETITRFSDPAIDDVVAHAKRAGVHEMILGMPQNYSTPLGDLGHPLSGGQRQRMALAQALFGRPRLLVMDEPDANIDRQGEGALVSAIDRASSDGTIIVLVTHNPALLALMDRILWIEGGKIAKLGPRDEVMAAFSAKHGGRATD